MFGRKRDLVDRPENEPKFDANNKADRKIVLTLVLVGLVVLILTIIAVIAFRGMMS